MENQDIQPTGDSSSQSINSSVPLTPPQQSAQEPTPKSKKPLLIAILVIIGLLLVGGGTFAYTYLFPSPGKVVSSMFTNLADVRSFEHKGAVENDATYIFGAIPGLTEQAPPTSIPQTFTISFDFEGATDFSEPHTIKNRAILKVKEYTEAPLIQVGLNFELELRNIGKELYIKLSDIPPIFAYDLSLLSNQWIKSDITGYIEQFRGGSCVSGRESGARISRPDPKTVGGN